MVAHRYAWTVLGNRLAWSVSRGDHKGHVCATRNGLVASGEKAVGEMEASSQWKLAVTLNQGCSHGPTFGLFGLHPVQHCGRF